MNPALLHQAAHIANKAHDRFTLQKRHLDAIEATNTSITDFITAFAGPDRHHLMPYGAGGFALSLRDDTEKAAGDAMHVQRRLNAVHWWCAICDKGGRLRPATDTGADAAGLDMLRHALAYPGHGPALELVSTRRRQPCPDPEQP